MKRKIFLVLFFVICKSISAQSNLDNVEKELNSLIIEKIKNYKPDDLIPYNIKNEPEYIEKWGFLDRKTLKRVTPPILDRLCVFNPDITFYYDDYIVKITNDYKLKIEEYHEYLSISNNQDEEGPIEVSEDIDGFEINDLGKITKCSKKHFFNISEPFMYKGDYYAIVRGKNKYYVINKQGKIKNNFTFKYIQRTDFKLENEYLFYVKDFNDTKGFITLSNKKKLYGELLSEPLNKFGYSYQNNGGRYHNSITKSGILDLKTMKWIIEPKNNYKIIDICYTSNEKIKSEKDFKNRKRVNVYFVVLDRKTKYIIDLEGKEYKPKK